MSQNVDFTTLKSSQLPSGVIDKTRLASSAVDRTKVDWANMDSGVVVSRFRITPNVSLADQTFNLTSRKGTAFTFKTANNGSVLYPYNGFGDVGYAKVIYAIRATSARTSAVVVKAVKSGSTVQIRPYPIIIDGGVTQNNFTNYTPSANWCIVSAYSGSMDGFNGISEARRDMTDNTMWHVFSRFEEQGTHSGGVFDLRLNAEDNLVFPTIYPSNFSGYTSSATFLVEVWETI